MGTVPELLSGTEEARLSMAGAVSDLDPGGGPFLIVDIGGGSTELVAGSGAYDPQLVAVSLQVGCVRVTERFLPPTLRRARAVRRRVDGQDGSWTRRVAITLGFSKPGAWSDWPAR